MSAKRPVKSLRKMKISEISLCGLGASPGANVSFFKAAGFDGEAVARGREILADLPKEAAEAFDIAVAKANEIVGAAVAKDATFGAEQDRDMSAGVYALAAAIDSAYDGDDAGLSDRIGKAADDFLAYAAETFGDPSPVLKETQSMSNMSKTEADPEGSGKITVPSKVDKAKDAGKKHPDGYVVGDVGKSVTLGDDEAVIKKSDLAEIIQKAQTEAVEKAVQPLRDQIAKMHEDKLDGERLTLAKSLCDGVPHATPEGVAAILKALDGDALKTEREAYIAGLNAQRISIGKAFVPAGADGQADDGMSAGDKISKMADDWRADQAKAGNVVSKAVAVDHVISQNPKLFAESRARVG